MVFLICLISLTNFEPLFVLFSLSPVASFLVQVCRITLSTTLFPDTVNLFSSLRASVSLHGGCRFLLCNIKSLYTESQWLYIITDTKCIIDKPRTTVEKLHLHIGLLFSRYAYNVSKNVLLTWRRTRWMTVYHRWHKPTYIGSWVRKRGRPSHKLKDIIKVRIR
jgi:hypothetical protein